MRVLFLTYPRIGLNRGGLQIQIEETAKGLTELGVEVVFYDPWRNQIPEVDLCHAFSIDGAVLPHLERAAESRKPVIVSPVFSAFAHGAYLTRVKVLLSSSIPGMYSDLRRAQRILNVASHVIALNADEESLIRCSFPSVSSRRITVIPNGIDVRFATGNPEIFRAKYKLGSFILTVGSIEPNKNQLALIQAMKQLDSQLVIIGRANRSYSDYFALCQKEASTQKNILFAGEIPHGDPLLASAFAASELFVLPSFSEVMPLSLYEAALAGCKVAASDSFPLQPEVARYVSRFTPTSAASISTVLAKELQGRLNEGLKNAVLTMPSWTTISRRILDIYEGLCV